MNKFKSTVQVDQGALLQMVTSATVCAQFGTPLVQHGGSPDSVSINRIDPAVKSYDAKNTEVMRAYYSAVYVTDPPTPPPSRFRLLAAQATCFWATSGPKAFQMQKCKWMFYCIFVFTKTNTFAQCLFRRNPEGLRPNRRKRAADSACHGAAGCAGG